MLSRLRVWSVEWDEVMKWWSDEVMKWWSDEVKVSEGLCWRSRVVRKPRSTSLQQFKNFSLSRGFGLSSSCHRLLPGTRIYIVNVSPVTGCCFSVTIRWELGLQVAPLMLLDLTDIGNSWESEVCFAATYNIALRLTPFYSKKTGKTTPSQSIINMASLTCSDSQFEDVKKCVCCFLWYGWGLTRLGLWWVRWSRGLYRTWRLVAAPCRAMLHLRKGLWCLFFSLFTRFCNVFR